MRIFEVVLRPSDTEAVKMPSNVELLRASFDKDKVRLTFESPRQVELEEFRFFVLKPHEPRVDGVLKRVAVGECEEHAIVVYRDESPLAKCKKCTRVPLSEGEYCCKGCETSGEHDLDCNGLYDKARERINEEDEAVNMLMKQNGQRLKAPTS
ncbi:MAG: hypothetical protein SGI77_23510 [Pirellulaceae bacterium]|nr:hypothetical protein [Pirellulaceae bacterium]